MALASRSMASAETCRKSAPFRAGSPPPARALSAPLQGGLRLLRLSSTPSVITLPCGRASVSRRDEWGLPCCPRGSYDRGGCALSSGGRWCPRRPERDLAIRPADLLVQATSLLGLFDQPLGPVLRLRTLDGRSLALSLSVSARADPDRGSQASAHCLRRSARRITPSRCRVAAPR